MHSRWLLPASLAVAMALSETARAGFEIADLTAVGADFKGYTRVLIDYGENPIPAEDWDAYVPPPGYIKNTPRTAQFNAENTFSSPGYPVPQVQVETISGYTWKFIAQTQSATWPYDSGSNPYEEAAANPTPAAGKIRFSSNEKNQEMIFWAREGNARGGAPILRYFITDQWGNEYIMGASGVSGEAAVTAAFEAAALPAGWTKSTGYLEETISLFPAYGAGDQAHFNLFRESGDNTFFQFGWGASGESIAGQFEDMPIWGGATNDHIQGRAGDNNLIHGAEGNDIIILRGENDSIYGDAGIDTVVFGGDYSDYALVSYGGGGTELVLSGFGFEKTIHDAEYLQFDDMTIATSAIPEPATGLLLLAAGGFLMLCRTRRPHAS